MTAKILVADDEQNITKLLRLYLRQEGYDVVVARDGREALDRFALGAYRGRGRRRSAHRCDSDHR